MDDWLVQIENSAANATLIHHTNVSHDALFWWTPANGIPYCSYTRGKLLDTQGVDYPSTHKGPEHSELKDEASFEGTWR